MFEPTIMIHTCNKREWYVYDYLLPSLVQQGIDIKNVIVWHDYNRIGNLHSCLKSYEWCKRHLNLEQGVWHLQDDVCISRDFYSKIKQYNNYEIVNGFCCKEFNKQEWELKGAIPATKTWNSYQCIRIKNSLAAQFHDWVYSAQCLRQKKYNSWYRTGKMDDSFWREWLLLKYPEKEVLNLTPSIVDHIDMLIGGSAINEGRKVKVCNGCYWNDPDSINLLIQKLREAGKLNEKWVNSYTERQVYNE